LLFGNSILNYQMSGDKETGTIPPPVAWAQRNNLIFLTICVEDCKNPQIDIKPEKLFFKGVGGTDKKTFETTLNFFKEIDTEKSKHATRGRNIEFILKKKEDGPYWPRLLQEKNKYHWLKIDFDKWKDEDDSEDEMGGPGGGGGGGKDIEEMMRQMGGLGGGGMGGMGGMPGMGGMGGGFDRPDLGDLDTKSDSDDDELPDLE